MGINASRIATLDQITEMCQQLPKNFSELGQILGKTKAEKFGSVFLEILGKLSQSSTPIRDQDSPSGSSRSGLDLNKFAYTKTPEQKTNVSQPSPSGSDLAIPRKRMVPDSPQDDRFDSSNHSIVELDSDFDFEEDLVPIVPMESPRVEGNKRSRNRRFLLD